MIEKQEFEQRCNVLRAKMDAAKIDAVVLVAGANMQYFLGVPWGLTERFVGAVISKDSIDVICPKFEDTALFPLLRIESSFCFWEEDEVPEQCLATLIKTKCFSKIAVDPKSPLWLFDRIRNAANQIDTALEFSNAESLIDPMRACKSDTEIALLQKAKDITLEVHKQAYDFLHPGLKSSEIQQFIDNAHRQLGADNGSYFCAVQFGEGTSHPHGVPGDPVLQENQLVLIDTGCRISGYHSDITRTYAFGKVSNEVEDMWLLEKAAQQAAFDVAKPGVHCEEVDHAARSFLIANGLGPDYKLPGLPHRTGHGIGLEIHEGPYLVRGDKTPLAKGMCFSNEPMIVVPNQYGIRLEDHFYITDTGARWFTEPQNSLYKPF